MLVPEREAAERVARSLAAPSIIEYLPLGVDFSLVELAAPKSFHGKSLADLGIRRKYRVMVVATKSGNHHELVPGANYEVKPSDVLVLIGRNVDLEALADREL